MPASDVGLRSDVARIREEVGLTSRAGGNEGPTAREASVAGVAFLQSSIAGLPLLARGKVRDIYDVGDQLLIVTTDRLSAFDVVMNEGIPGRGRVLTSLSVFWFDSTRDIVPNHLLSCDLAEMPGDVADQPDLDGRTMLVRRGEVLPVECIVRGYLAGSGFKEYQRTGAICGVDLPPGLRIGDRLPEPIFTPSTKAEQGHDENISFARMEKVVGSARAARLRDLSLEIYRRGAEVAEAKGILLADTKFEFAVIDDEIVLVDEVLTPDSSRFWDAEAWSPGTSPDSFDKQIVRDWLETTDWDKQPPPPTLPAEIVEKTRDRYRMILERLTGLPS
jgi:phosphoribosylaminoimidazole-succinocarboxamide synthase